MLSKSAVLILQKEIPTSKGRMIPPILASKASVGKINLLSLRLLVTSLTSISSAFAT